MPDHPQPVPPAQSASPAETGPADRTAHRPADHGTVTAEAPRRSPYSLGSTSNMLRSLLVIGLFVAVLIAIVPRVNKVDRPAVDAMSKAQFTASQTGWAVELPHGLGEGWVPTVATFGPGTDKVPTLTTVYTTPGGGDIALKQAAAPTAGWLTRSVADGASSGTVAVGGREVERYAADGASRVSYVVRVAEAGEGAAPLTLVVSSSSGEDELRTFVAALKPVPDTP